MERAYVSKLRELFLTSTKEGSRLEDQLSDYQPPKQYVKKEEKESRASPTVFITDSRSRESTPSGTSDTSAEYTVKPSKPFNALRASWGTPTGDSDNQCKACGKRVYAMEKMQANKAVYHKTCFRCCECKSVLRVGNFAAMEGKVYCKPHFMSLFKTKGNYDEGFGRQRHSALWTNKDGTPGKDDAPEEYYEDTPRTDDLRKNYEDEDEDEYDGENREILHESLEREEIHFAEMNSVRSKFESASHSPDEPSLTPKSARPASKWDKPKGTPPAPINPHSDDDEILSPGEGEEYGGLRRFTPPRDELEGQVREVYESEPVHDPNVVRHDDQGYREDELPPPSMAKTIAAKFRSMEDLNQPPVTPEAKISKKQTEKSYSVPRQTAPQYERAPEPVTYNGIEEPDATPMIEDEAKPEEELPERGFTSSLVAQWRTREQVSSPAGPTPTKSTKSKTPSSTTTGSSRSWSPVQTKHTSSTTAHTPPLANGDHRDGHDTKDDEHLEETASVEDELPPPAMARNLRAKFENMAMENEQEVEAMTPRTLRKFKFAVKETGFHVRTPNDDDIEAEYTEASPYSDNEENFYENVEESLTNEAPESDYVRSDDHTNIIEEELPPTAFTRNMLAKFRSMEDVNKPPPTPEYAEKQVKNVTSGAHRMTNSNVRSLSTSSPEHGSHFEMEMEREQPDGAYQQEAVSQQEYDYNNYDDYNAEGGEFENEPELNPNVIRESDKLDGDELPELGTTRSLLAKFQTLQAH